MEKILIFHRNSSGVSPWWFTDEQTQQGLRAGVQGTPHTLVNGVQIGGAVPYAQLKALIEAELK